MDWGPIAVNLAISLMGTAGVGALLLLRQQRRKLDASSSVDEAAAQVDLSEESRALIREAVADAHAARQEAREAREEAAHCRRKSVELWARLDAFDRWARNLEQCIRDAGGEVPSRPLDLDHPLL